MNFTPFWSKKKPYTECWLLFPLLKKSIDLLGPDMIKKIDKRLVSYKKHKFSCKSKSIQIFIFIHNFVPSTGCRI